MTHLQDKVHRICLWSGPRNISTALMYAFAQRADTRVYDEPLYAHYLAHTSAKSYHPGAEEILRTMDNDGSRVVEMILGAHDSDVVFFKHMTHHLVQLDLSFLDKVTNVILTRDPVEMLPSYAKEVTRPTIDDVGYKRHVDVIKYLNENNHPPIVIESKRMLQDPNGMMSKLCERLGIEFDPNMLKWKAGPRKEDGCWAKYWYNNVHLSTGFQAYAPKTKPFPDYLKPLLEECMPFYNEVLELAI